MTAVLALAGPPEASAGAWAQPQGQYYAKVSTILYASDEVYNDMGDRAAMGMDGEEFTSRQAFAYIEYGLLPKLSLVGQTSLGRLEARSDFTEQITEGLGDLELGLKYQVLERPLAVAAQLKTKLPTGYHDEYMPPLGTGSADLEMRLLGGMSLYPLPMYAGVEGGYRLRGGRFSDQIPYAMELGGSPHDRVFAKGYVQGEWTRSEDREPTGLVGSLQVSEGDLHKLGLNGAVRLSSNLWLDFLWERVIAGENVGAGTSWGVGLAVTP